MRKIQTTTRAGSNFADKHKQSTINKNKKRTIYISKQ